MKEEGRKEMKEKEKKKVKLIKNKIRIKQELRK